MQLKSLIEHASLPRDYESLKFGDLYLHQIISIISTNVYFKTRKGSIQPKNFGDTLFNYIVLAFIGPILMGNCSAVLILLLRFYKI